MLEALELEGIHIFKFSLNSFDKEYKLTVQLHEYIDGKRCSSKNIYLIENNIYTYFVNNSGKDSSSVMYKDYIDQLIFYTKTENDSTQTLKLKTYAGSDMMQVKTNKSRSFQFYNWRSYSKTGWILNKEIPLLICASSWYDSKNEIERFCGVVDLSLNKEETEELLKSSPHYFLITYTISER